MSRRVFVAVVALAAAVIAGLGLQTARLNDRGRLPSTLNAQMNQTAWQTAISSPDAREITLKSADGSRSALAVVRADGTSLLGPNNLPVLSNRRSYQVWGRVGAGMVSLAVLRTASAYQEFSTPAQTMALIITDEPAGGVIATTSPAVVSARMPAQ